MARFACAGLQLAYDDIRPAAGEAGTAILVHGFAANRAETWRRLSWYAAFERKGWRVIALDLRGHGESDKPHEPAAYDRAEMAADIIRLADHLGLGRLALVGYSMGAHLAAATAADHPSRVEHLVLGGVGARSLERRPLGDGQMTMAQAMRAATAEDIAEPTLKGFRLFADEQGADRLALAACSEGQGPGLAESLDRLAAPTLIVAGARDELAGDPQTLADRVSGARAVTIPGCDHFSTTPHALFKAAVFDFLEGWEEDPWEP
ncbi:MAG TPA: alpha/beta fold hydrolase [Caulobacteraceae bacterium]|nr:alpha/beta fold hydrolase [Caulobacteraceae bacterium]